MKHPKKRIGSSRKTDISNNLVENGRKQVLVPALLAGASLAVSPPAGADVSGVVRELCSGNQVLKELGDALTNPSTGLQVAWHKLVERIEHLRNNKKHDLDSPIAGEVEGNWKFIDKAMLRVDILVGDKERIDGILTRQKRYLDNLQGAGKTTLDADSIERARLKSMATSLWEIANIEVKEIEASLEALKLLDKTVLETPMREAVAAVEKAATAGERSVFVKEDNPSTGEDESTPPC